MSDDLRWLIYPDEEFRGYLVRLGRAELPALEAILNWMDQHHPEDERAAWIKKHNGVPNRHYPERLCLDALLVLGIHPCGLCRGCDWPALEIKTGCRSCVGTGWTHHVILPPGCGFTLGWAPGMFDLPKENESSEQTRARVQQESGKEASEVFKLCYPMNGKTFVRLS